MPDLGEAAGEHRRRLDPGRQRLGAGGEGGIVGERIDAMPVGRGGGVDRGVELVAAGGAERRLVARDDLDLIEERHLALAPRRAEDRDQRGGLGLDAVRARARPR